MREDQNLLKMGTLVTKQENMRKPLTRLAVDIIFFIILVTPTWLFNLTDVVTVNRRGFYCNDDSIRYPYRPNTLPSLTLFLVGLPLVILAVLVIEYCYYKWVPMSPRKRGMFHPLLVSLYRLFGFFIVGANINQFLTDTTKLTVGRLRPYFMDYCQPDVACNMTNEHTYILDYKCTRTGYPNMSQKEFENLATDVRKAFPSGHSSFAMYCTIFGILYLELRLKWRTARMFKICCQTLTLVAGVWACCTRYLDNKHHPGDIIGGALYGGSVALLVTYFYHRSMTYVNRKDKSMMRSVAPTGDSSRTGSASLQMDPDSNGDVSVAIGNPALENDGTTEM